jgi:hypothetical protein
MRSLLRGERPSTNANLRSPRLHVDNGVRAVDTRVLRWDDIAHGVVDIARAYNRRQPGEVKGTKSGSPRRFAVEPNVRPLLDAMRMEAGGKGLVIELASERAMARNFRRWLWKPASGVRLCTRPTRRAKT